MANQVVYNITFNGNAAAFTSQLTSQMGGLQAATNNATGAFSKFQANLISLNQGIQVLRDLSATLRETSEPGLKLNSAMQELSAITGVTGSKLQEIEGYARAAAKTFGGSAAQGVESYKLILSKLSPEIAKVPEALSAMGNSAMTLSKTMGNDVVAATQVLSTAMNQYQVSLADPLKASGVMAEMMNIMAAAAREGSAELPEIQTALEQAGMAAKMAGVSFAETNAAIQVLDKAGKKGAEGGVAIRNMLATLSEGRFLPKEVISELSKAGVSIDVLGDKSISFAARLTELKKIVNDSALVTKLFGKENNNAALALISGIPLMQQYTTAIQGTKSAEEQAAIVMQSKEEQLARIKAKMDDYKISLFNLTGNMLPFAEIATSALVPISQMIPLIAALSKGIKAFSFTSVIAGFASFKIAAITACRAVGVAIMSIPVFGWIAAALAALGAAAVWAWNKFEGFRKAVMGVWEVVKLFGVTLYNSVLGIVKNLISGLGSLGSALLKLFKFDFKGAVAEAKSAMNLLSKSTPISVGISLVNADYKGAWAKGQQKGAESWAKSQDKPKEDDNTVGEQYGPTGADMQVVTPTIKIKNLGASAKASGISFAKLFAAAIKNDSKHFQIGIDPKVDLIKGADGVKKLNSYNDAIEEMKKKIGEAKELNTLFGNSQSFIKDQMELTKSAITDLINQGYAAASPEIQKLIEQYRLLGLQVNKTAEKSKQSTDLMLQGISYLSSAVSSVGTIVGGSAGDWISWAASAIGTIGSVIGEIVSLIAAQAAAGIASQAKLAFPYNLVAMAATAAGLASIIASVPKHRDFAAGGLVYGETFARVGEYPGASNNPEVIAPLSKLKNMLGSGAMSGEVRFEIEGDKLVGVLNKYYNKRRLG